MKTPIRPRSCDEQWRFCQYMRSAQCGIYLECGGDTFACVTNLQSRETRN